MGSIMIKKSLLPVFALFLSSLQASTPIADPGIDLSHPVSLPFFQERVKDATEKYPDLFRSKFPNNTAAFTQEFRSWVKNDCKGDIYKACTTYAPFLEHFLLNFKDFLKELIVSPEDVASRSAQKYLLELQSLKQEETTFWNLYEKYFEFIRSLGDCSYYEKYSLSDPSILENFISLIENQTFINIDRNVFRQHQEELCKEGCLYFLRVDPHKELRDLCSTVFEAPCPIIAFNEGIFPIPLITFMALQDTHCIYGKARNPDPYHDIDQDSATCFGIMTHDVSHLYGQSMNAQFIEHTMQRIKDYTNFIEDGFADNEEKLKSARELGRNKLIPAVITYEHYRCQSFKNCVTYFLMELINQTLLENKDEKKFKRVCAGLFLVFHESHCEEPQARENVTLQLVMDSFVQESLVNFQNKPHLRDLICVCPTTGIPHKENKPIPQEKFIQEFNTQITKILNFEFEKEFNLKEFETSVTYIPLSDDPKSPIINIALRWAKTSLNETGTLTETYKYDFETIYAQLKDRNYPDILEWAGIPIEKPVGLDKLSSFKAHAKALNYTNTVIDKQTCVLIQEFSEAFKEFIQDPRYKLENQYSRQLKRYGNTINEIEAEIGIPATKDLN